MKEIASSILLCLVPALGLQASPLSMNLASSSLSVAPDHVATFYGTITNNSGSTLDAATDLFLNFDGFDPAAVTPAQLLGSPDFSLAQGQTSSNVALFSLLVGTLPPDGDATIDVTLEDVSGDLSDPVTASVMGSSQTVTPEPRNFLLISPGILALLFVRKRSLYSTGKCLASVALVGLPPCVNAQTPSFSTQSPAAALAGSKFEVILPLVNSGRAAANSVQVTAVELSSAGVVKAALLSPNLPLQIGSFHVGAEYILDFAFSAQPLTKGSNYLLTVRGTYSLGGTTLGFAVNRPVVLSGSSPFGGPGKPIAVTPELDSAHMASELMVASLGGTLSTTGADGTVFTLTVPPNALLGDELITMTPLTGLPGAPLARGIAAGVQLEPDGLQFLSEVTLTIQPSKDVPIADQVGFSYPANGQDFALAPLANSDTITFNFSHFTGYGVGVGPVTQPVSPASSIAQLETEVAQLLQQERTCQLTGSGCSSDLDQTGAKIEELAQLFYEQIVLPQLDEALTDWTSAYSAIQQAWAWLRQVEIMHPAEALPEPFETDKEYINQVIPKILVNAFNQIGPLCIASSSSAERADYAIKLLSIVRYFAIMYGDPEQFLGSGYAKIYDACVVGPVDFSFNSNVDGSQAQPNLSAAEESHVEAQTARLKPDTDGDYPSVTVALDYVSFSISSPGYCSLTWSTKNGTLDVSGTFDINIFPDLHPYLLVTVEPDIEEDVTYGEQLQTCQPFGPYATNFYGENLVVAHTPGSAASYRVLVNSSRAFTSAGTTSESLPTGVVSTATASETSNISLTQSQ